MIYTCPVPGCGALHEMGSDHQNEPCLSCWKHGWRVDAFGKVFQDLPRVPPHPADDVHVE